MFRRDRFFQLVFSIGLLEDKRLPVIVWVGTVGNTAQVQAGGTIGVEGSHFVNSAEEVRGQAGLFIVEFVCLNSRG